MSIILCLSSQVARGYVGGSATRIALERMGHECWLMPTVILSNHPAHARFAGEQVPVGRLRAMVEVLEANGWLGDVDAVMTGYMPSAEHVALAVRAIAMVRGANPQAHVLCDPILGDDPGGLYVDEVVARAIRDELLPLASIATPNRFELEWMSGERGICASTACGPAQALGPGVVLVTSLIGALPQSLTNLVTSSQEAWLASVPRRNNAPHGVGDLMAALFLGALLKGLSAQEALGRATAGVEMALDASKMSDELRLAAAEGWADAALWAVERVSYQRDIPPVA